MQVIQATFADGEGEKAVEILENIGVKESEYKLISSKTGDLLIINLTQEDADNVIDKLKARFDFDSNKKRSLMIYTPDIALTDEDDKQKNGEQKPIRETIIAYAKENSHLTSQIIVMAFAAAIIATLGLILDNTAVIVGSMIIAPVFGPIATMAIGIVLGDLKLLLKGFLVEATVMLIAVLVGAVFGFIVPNVGINRALEIRMLPTIADLLVAIAAGGAGAYSLMTDTKSQQLVGVVIAAALIPVMATIGIGFSIQNIELITGATLLLLSNFFALLLIIVLVFYIKGLKPQWWYASEAKKVIKRSLLILAISIIVLILPVSTITYQQMIKNQPVDIIREIYREEFQDEFESKLFDVSVEDEVIELSVYSPIEKAEKDFIAVTDRIRAELGQDYEIKFEIIPTYQYRY